MIKVNLSLFSDMSVKHKDRSNIVIWSISAGGACVSGLVSIFTCISFEVFTEGKLI